MSKYFRRFDNETDYNVARKNNYDEPWVSYVESTENVNYNKTEYEKLFEMPLTTIAKENGAISFNIWKSMGTDMITSVSYSTDGGETWTTTNNTNNKSEHLAITVSVNEGDRVMWKANAQQTGYFDENDYSDYVGSFFSSTCEFDVEGNVMSMMNDVTGLTYVGQLCCLFYNYDGETECFVVDASKLLLPTTTLANGCYSEMFEGCTSLTTAPALPATTLADYCYSYMFYGCTSLTIAPELPATTLTPFCYHFMFYGCTNLTTAPSILPATTLADYCYSYMFYGCTSLTIAPELPATTLTPFCYYIMFNGCTSLVTAPELPATTLANNCYREMFNGCTSLTTAPSILPATTLANGCYQNMFNGCTNLTQAPELPATTLAENCYSNMFSTCTSLTTAPELPATTLAYGCYNRMFQGCSNLNYIKCLATNISASLNCTYNWVSGVSSTGTFVKDSNMTGWTTGNNGIPVGWVTCNDNELALSKTSKYVPESSSVIQLKVISPSNWSASTTDNWIVVPQKQGSGGTTDIRIVVGSTTTPRDGTVTFTDGETSVAFTVIQSDNAFQPLTVEALEDGTIQCVYDGSSNDYVYSVKYSINGGEMVVCQPTMNNPVEIDVSEGDKVSFYYNGSDYYYYAVDSSNEYFFHILINDASAKLYGNIMSLCDAENFEDYTTIDYDSQFKYFFINSSSLVDASNLILPATTLAANCYDSMFEGCTSLVQAPVLPATTLARECYRYMFSGCTSLTTAPELPATTLASFCYYYMFYGCTSLTQAPELPATTLANYCYYYMFNGCTSLTTAPALPATTLADYCYQSMFRNCTGLTTAPSILPATTLAYGCYANMFRECTSLVSAPELPATTLTNQCYEYMFNGCTSLTIAPELPATTLANNCYGYMFQNCTSLTTAPELPATTLTVNCYQQMFVGCSKLNYIKCLATDKSAANCTSNWVNGVASTGTFVKDSNMTGWTRGISGIPSGWTVQDAS